MFLDEAILVPCRAVVVGSCHMVQAGTASGGLCRKVCHHSPAVGARHHSCEGEGDSGEMLLLLLWGSLWAQLWMGMAEEGGESGWRVVSMLSMSLGHCAAQIFTRFWLGRLSVAS